MAQSGAEQQAVGCGGLIVLAFFFSMIVSKCSEDSDESVEPLLTIAEEISQLRQDIPAKKIEINGQLEACESELPLYGRSVKEEGERSQLEWDIAAGENVDNISRAQEWEIRKSLGAEMGLAPSEVNGWKSIYRGRAEMAKRRLQEIEQEQQRNQSEWKNHKQARCDLHARLLEELKEMQAELKELENING